MSHIRVGISVSVATITVFRDIGEVLTDLEKGIKSKENELNEWEVKMEKKRKEEHEQMKRNQEGLENYKKELSARAELNMQGQNTNFGPLGKKVLYYIAYMRITAKRFKLIN